MAKGIEVSDEDDTQARWGWEFKIVWDNYVEETSEGEAQKKLNELLDIVEKVLRIRAERAVRAERFEARFQVLQRALEQAVPELIKDPILDYTCLNAYYQHLHHCPDDSP